MNVMALIERLDDELRNASGLPLTGKKLVDTDNCLRIISDLRINLPDDIKDAERIVNEKNEILNAAENEAQAIIDEAERRFAEMLDEHAVTMRAYEQADEILAEARAEAEEIRLGATSYAEEILSFIEQNAHNTLGEIAKSRAELKEILKQFGIR